MKKIYIYFLLLAIFINKAIGCETLYSGKDILVEVSFFGSKNIWVCFNEVKGPQFGHEFQEDSETHFKAGKLRWGQPFLSKSGIDAINIVNLTNHWYQTEEMKEVLDIVTAYIKSKDYENTITYGLSMGGYGAILFAEQLKATRVLAFGPQIQFNDIDRMNYTYWRELLNLQPIFAPPQHYNSCDFYIFFGSENKIDRTIVEDPEGLPEIVSDPLKRHLFSLKTAQHNIAIFLHEHSLLKRVVSWVDKGEYAELLKSIDPLLDKPEPLNPSIYIPLGLSFDLRSPIILGDGFYGMEDEGLWSSAKSEFILTFPEADKPYEIDINYHAFVSCAHPRLTFRLINNGDEVFKGFAGCDEDQSLFDFPYTPTDLTVKFTLEVDPTTSPLALGLSDDARILGLFFKSLRITEEQ